jgi:Domain of unknown function (DUF4157)
MLQIVLCISLSAFIPASTASACGNIFDVDCNLHHGGMDPDNQRRQAEKVAQDAANALKKAGQDAAKTAEKAAQDVARALDELQASVLTGPALEQAINSSHDSALYQSLPIPPEIRQQLAGYASEDSMNRVHYKIGENGFANIAQLIERGGLATAVTLIDVIVFRGPSEADNPALWAHELTHVDQYHEWGVHSFAVQYMRDLGRSVEQPAIAKGNGFWAWQEQHQGSSSAPSGAPQSLGVPVPGQAGSSQVGWTCEGKWRIMMMQPQPVGTPCVVNLPSGASFPGIATN